MQLGAHLVTPRLGYEHHGIYAGGGRVIHYAGFRSRLGEKRYRFLSNNCEHFAEWCTSGASRSSQEEAWLDWFRMKPGSNRPATAAAEHVTP